MNKISVIMPVYNCEEYLKESINSVLQQTLQEWELLCIDDGSTDKSLEILKEYKEKDKRIQIFTQQNQGAGSARNLGLRNAKGEFVSFLDADDFFLDKDALECMYDTCKTKGIKACGASLRALRNGKIGQDNVHFKEVEQAAHGQKILNYEDFQFDYGYTCFIFERQVINEHAIWFPPYRRFQDPPFLVRAMYAIGQFCYIDKSLYCYRMPNVSKRFTGFGLEGLLKGLCDNLVFAKEKGLSLLFQRTVMRLEEEYEDIIFHNMAEVENLQLLLKINEIIRDAGKPDYVIRPLQRMFDSMKEVEKYQLKDFESRLMGSDRIYVYGAGKKTSDFFIYLRDRDLFHRVKGILVSDTKDNPDQVEGIVVKSVAEYKYQKGDIVIIAVSGMYQQEIASKLDALGVLDYRQLIEVYNGE